MANVLSLLLVLLLTILLNLPGIIPRTGPVLAATPDELKWARVNIPTEGKTGNWVLANGSDVQHLTMARDGTIYAHATPSSTSYTLFKSADGGSSWTQTGKVTDAIVDIAIAPDDPGIIYYATPSSVYKSSNAGEDFIPLPPAPGGAGSDNITITDIDVTRLEGNSIIAVGTADRDELEYGGVYLLDEKEPFTGWIDTGLDGLDVYTVAFSPNFIADRQLVTIATDEADTLVAARTGAMAWGTITANALIAGVTPKAASIAFPDDYDASGGQYNLFMALDTGSEKGDVYLVNGIQAPGESVAADMDIGSAYNLSNIDVTSLAVSGNATGASLLAGTAGSAQVYVSTDSGLNWERSTKAPTGQDKTSLLIAPDFANSHLAYAATTGANSAFSYTTDGGATWNQLSLMDTLISQNGISTLAISPDYELDNSLFMLTFDAEHLEHSLWRSLRGGVQWERVFTGTQAGADSLSLVELSPDYNADNRTVFLAGTSGGNTAIWKSNDNGQSFNRQNVPFPVDAWAVASDSTLFMASYDGNNGLVYRTTNSGLFYSAGGIAGNQPLNSITLSPDYENDRTILVGNTNGRVYLSKDDGASFEPLPPDITPPQLSGELNVTFDPEFASSRAIYAASNANDEGIYRFVIGKSGSWEEIDTDLTNGATLGQISVSADGTLYTVNSQPVDSGKKQGGMERSLNPAFPLNPTFETVTRGLEDGATLTKLFLQDNQLWSIDTLNTRLMTFIDSLAQPVTLTSPANRLSGIYTKNITLEWETLKGAAEYEWQLNDEANFSTVPSEFTGKTQARSVRLPPLEPATAYYWRVRATQPVLSRWSDKWMFTTSLDEAGTNLELHIPEAGAAMIPVQPVFQWGAVPGAESYELLVATEPSFSSPVIAKTGNNALPATAWRSDTDLKSDTTYYWKVRPLGSGSHGAWSAVGAFTTTTPTLPPPPEPPEPSPSPALPESPPIPQPSPQLSPPSQPPQQPPSITLQLILPDWVIYMTGGLLSAIVLLLITLLFLVIRRGRY